MLWHHSIRVNSHQRWKQMRFRVCFHLWCELTSTMNETEWQVSWNSRSHDRLLMMQWGASDARQIIAESRRYFSHFIWGVNCYREGVFTNIEWFNFIIGTQWRLPERAGVLRRQGRLHQAVTRILTSAHFKGFCTGERRSLSQVSSLTILSFNRFSFLPFIHRRTSR